MGKKSAGQRRKAGKNKAKPKADDDKNADEARATPSTLSANARAIASLARLAESLIELDEEAVDGGCEFSVEESDDGEPKVKGVAGEGESTELTNNGTADVDVTSDSTTAEATEETKVSGLPLSHWRTLSTEVETAYKMLNEGAEYVKATSTKYTLVGKIDMTEGEKLAVDMRKGAELMATGTLLLFSPPAGCSRALRRHAKRSSRAVVASILSLLRSFEDGSAYAIPDGEVNNRSNTVGAQRTGAVWSACDGVRLQVPKGNRAAIRRELMLWARDCNESVQEFEELVELGASSLSPMAEEEEEGAGKASANGNGNDDDEWDNFCGNVGTGDQYTQSEIGLAKSCLNIVKCSRNVIGLVLKACECAGQVAEEATAPSGESDEVSGDNDKERSSHRAKRKTEVLQWISDLHELSRRVGEGVTDLGVLLYPPLDFSDTEMSADESCEEGKDTAGGAMGRSNLGLQISYQINAVSSAVDCILDATPPGASAEKIEMSEEVLETAGKLQKAIQTRTKDAENAMRFAISNK